MSNLKILIVEDEAIIAEHIAILLRNMGYCVVGIVASGEDAIATVVQTNPDLVLMDIMLQGEMDGVEAADKISQFCEIPIVYLTANADDRTLKRASNTLPFGYIIKPFKAKELQVTIEIAISRHQAEVEMKKAIEKAEQQRIIAQQEHLLQNEYFSMASHDLRTPISIIKISAHLLQDYSQMMSEDKRHRHLQRIKKATDSLNQLLEDILTLAHSESDQTRFSPAPLDVVSFCQDLVESIQMSMGDRYTIQFQHQGDCSDACLDEKLLWHLLNNLLSNAIKYSPNGGLIELRLSAKEDTICFQIQDRGIGISPEDQRKLFKPFFRAANVGTIPGTGLGLAIVQRSVELHQGQLGVESLPNQGTTFTVTLPMNKNTDTDRSDNKRCML
ncbi:MAG: ATP-binding protein [Microcoleaceae cyanobacterium]